MTRYILGEDADRDLDGIWDYIAADNVDAADRWIGQMLREGRYFDVVFK